MYRKIIAISLPALLLVAILAAVSVDRVGAADEPAAPAKEKKAKAKEAHGRLPMFFDDLVDGEQRQKIYAIQAEHNPEIKKLNTALLEAKAKRDAAIEAILRPDQKEKLAKLQADAKAKGKAAMNDDDEKPSDAATTPAPTKDGKSS
jgi:Spy/CpxP family protein refolding chaperone